LPPSLNRKRRCAQASPQNRTIPECNHGLVE